MEDWQLLQDYAAHHSEKAFRSLVDRYLGLVRSAAVRQVNDPNVADEVTQAVFILLARKAGHLGRGVILSAWLYRTTRFVATRAQRSEQRRRNREREAFNMHQLSTPDEAWQRIGPLLDDAMAELREVDRNALILRFFQDQSLLQVGNRLGVSEEAAKKRVARALDKLRSYFMRHGFSVSSTVVGAAMAAHSVQAASASLATLVLSAGMSQGAAASSAALPLLVQQTLAAWRWTRFRLAGGIVAALLGVALLRSAIPGTTRSLNGDRSMSEAGPAPIAGIAATALPVQSSTAVGSTPRATNSAYLAFRAIDSETGTGLANARILLVTARDWDQIKQRTDLVTDETGRCDVPLGDLHPQMVVVGVLAEGYTERCFFWGANQEALPAEYTLKVPRGARIGGLVRDEAGQPIAGADIMVQFFGVGDASWREFQRERPGFPADDLPVAKTDGSGRWSFGSAARTNGEFWIEVRHPDFPKTGFHLDGDSRNYIDARRVKFQDLLAGKAVLVLPGGFSATGLVLDDQRNPIIGAKVSAGRWAAEGNSTATTTVDGSFRLVHLPAGQTFLTVTARGFAPDRREIQLSPESPPITFELKPASLLRLRVLNQADEPLDHARVALEQWRGEHNILEWAGFTDKEGRIEWTEAPQDAMTFFASKEGYFYSRNNQVQADGQEHAIRLHPQVIVSGAVVDADTRQPIASFKAIPGTEANLSNERGWERHRTAYGTNGVYQLRFEEFSPELRVRFEADGYEPAISSPLAAEAGSQTCNMQLKPVNPSEAVHGVVYEPDGNPARAAQVALCTLEKGVSVGKGQFLERAETISTDSDAQGRFSFQPAADAHTVVAINSRGFGRVRLDGANRSIEIRLQPFGRIEGNLRLRGESNADREVTLFDESIHNYHGAVAVNYGSFNAKTDATGHFVLEQVPALDLDLFFVRGVGIPFSHKTPVDIRPGETVQVQIGGTGRFLSGRFVAAGLNSIDWSKQVQFATLANPPKPIAWPTNLSGSALEKWKLEFWQSNEGRARAHEKSSYAPKIEQDGSFTIDSVAPGSYNLTAYLNVPNRTGSINKRIEVPEADDNSSDASLDIGAIEFRW